jgi:haloalkane dehalogenase
MTAVHRTPDARFAGLPDLPGEPSYVEWEGLRLAFLDLGPRDGSPVVLFHGEPTWSYLWRHVVPPLVAAGHRCVLPDLPGFGRSDKPTDVGWYTWERHVAAAEAVLEAAAVRGAAFVVHDWGGPVGLRLAVARPDQCARMAAMDTGLFTGQQRMSDAWRAFRDFVERTEDVPVGLLVRGGCHGQLPDDVVAAYDAPYDTVASKAGARAFPLLIPLTPDAPGAREGRAVLDALAADARPKLVLWADQDPVLPATAGERFAERIGAPPPVPIEGAGHFLQEDAGPAIGARPATA